MTDITFGDRVMSFFGMMRWNVLARIINDKKFERVCEVGVAKAWTSEYVLKHCSSVRVYWGVDPYIDSDRVDQKEVAVKVFSKYNNSLLLVETSEQASRRESEFDVVFIDAAHDYESVKKDVLLWLPKVKKGGYLCGHDYDKKEVRKAVHEILGEKNIDEDDDQVWIYEVRSGG